MGTTVQSTVSVTPKISPQLVLHFSSSAAPCSSHHLPVMKEGPCLLVPVNRKPGRPQDHSG
jgi:hypothetical protein